jgi:O-acetyl-ADP-ribose deacetylase (regulator of RNase III)
VQDQGNNREDQQNVNAEAGDVESKESTQPQNQQNDKSYQEHIVSSQLLDEMGGRKRILFEIGYLTPEGGRTMPARAKIQFLKGDITEMPVDAVVNAANNDLVLGTGVAGAIRAKGGPWVEEECYRIGTIPLGEAAVTTGGSLKAVYVIHAASMRLGGRTTAEHLRLATHNALMRAEERGIKSIAFPAIGTGVAGFPIEDCARVMITQVLDHLKSRSSLEKIYFVLYDETALKTFEDVYQQLTVPPPNP